MGNWEGNGLGRKRQEIGGIVFSGGVGKGMRSKGW